MATVTRDAAVPITDDALRPIADRVQGGGRLDFEDIVALYQSHDLLGIGALADLANRGKNGYRVFFAANQHINPTNICVLRNVCTFCSFARMPTEAGAYTRTAAEVLAEASRAKSGPTKEFHIVGGLHPKLPLRHYTDMIRALRDAHLGVHIKALTAVEIAHLARIEKTSILEVLLAIRDAGLTSLPGGGAEVFSTAVRATIADRKLAGEEWIAVHRQAHALCIPSSCMMLYGHVETARDRAEHLLLRGLQDESGGFLTYVPLAYHADNNELGEQMGWAGRGRQTMGVDDLKNVAIGRLALDNVPHVETHWPMVTSSVSQVALDFGCEDIEGTVVFERVYHDAGAETPMEMSYDDLVRLICGAGRVPVERDSLYKAVRTFD